MINSPFGGNKSYRNKTVKSGYSISGTVDWKLVQMCNLNILIILGKSLENKTSVNQYSEVKVNFTNKCG